MKDSEKSATKPSSARRKFLKGAGIAAATGTAVLSLAACDDKPKKEAKKADNMAAPQVSKAKTQVLKVQTSQIGLPLRKEFPTRTLELGA